LIEVHTFLLVALAIMRRCLFRYTRERSGRVLLSLTMVRWFDVDRVTVHMEYPHLLVAGTPFY
jgi:RNase P/RNase MRP subunit POP5